MTARRISRAARIELASFGLAVGGALATVLYLWTGTAMGIFAFPGGDYLYVFDVAGDALREGRSPYGLAGVEQALFYAPPWALIFAAISWLPPFLAQGFLEAAELFALRYIVGSWRRVGYVAWCPLLAFELVVGNTNLIVAGLIVASVRGHAWAGILGAAAKLSPILAVRDWRAGLRWTIVLGLVSLPWMAGWLGAVGEALRHGTGGPLFPVPLPIRAVAALGLLVLRRSWATTAAAVIAIPGFYYQSLIMLVAPLAVWAETRKTPASVRSNQSRSRVGPSSTAP